MQHVRVYRDSLPTIKQRVREELVSRYGGQPLYAPRNKGLAMGSMQFLAEAVAPAGLQVK